MIMKKIRHYLLISTSLLIATPTLSLAKSNAALPLDEIRNFVDVYNTIRNEYVEEKDGKTLIDFAIEGMLNGLDPHSVYLKKSQIDKFKDSTSGSYVGFGLQLDIVQGDLIIISPIPDSPAEKAGLKPNDHIIKIDDTVIKNLSMAEISELLDNDSVNLTIARQGEKTQQFSVTKTRVVLPSVKQQVLDNDYGYIRISQFQPETANQFNNALAELLDKDVKGLVLDVRNNPGGLVKTATDIANQFLDAGLIVSTKNPNTGTEDKVHADKDTLAKDLPMVVMINEGSASASELLAGALQSHKRAIIVGQRSFGKGSVQNVIPLTNGSAIKLTTARYYTPNGESIQAKGITPDIFLSQLKVDDKALDLLSYSEADMAGHLTQSRKAKPSAEKTEASEATDDALGGTALAKADLQLFEALNVLKVLNITK